MIIKYVCCTEAFRSWLTLLFKVIVNFIPIFFIWCVISEQMSTLLSHWRHFSVKKLNLLSSSFRQHLVGVDLIGHKLILGQLLDWVENAGDYPMALGVQQQVWISVLSVVVLVDVHFFYFQNLLNKIWNLYVFVYFYAYSNWRIIGQDGIILLAYEVGASGMGSTYLVILLDLGNHSLYLQRETLDYDGETYLAWFWKW